MDRAGELHLAVCRRFSEAVSAANGKWDRQSPCDEWDARSVLEHVIGFHDVLLLRPLGLKPDRPRDDPQVRWELTYARLVEAFEHIGSGVVVDVPGVENGPGRRSEMSALIPKLTLDVLVHTWDLARAVGADDRLNRDWCEFCYAALPEDPAALSSSGMFNRPVSVGNESDVQSKLLARLGRYPLWRPSPRG